MPKGSSALNYVTGQKWACQWSELWTPHAAMLSWIQRWNEHASYYIHRRFHTNIKEDPVALGIGTGGAADTDIHLLTQNLRSTQKRSEARYEYFRKSALLLITGKKISSDWHQKIWKEWDQDQIESNLLDQDRNN